MVIFLIQNLGAQDSKLPKGLNLFIAKPSQEKLTERQQLFNSVDTTDLNENDRYFYYLIKSRLL